ncbi:hypothetical protein [Stenomitos frigidus]|uniref:hypothetical protein n=1 Tax=Stenomitos frigidus TaxID=1886765 RepID=UPI0015E73ECE|nr:hypothetical protein [Stenomitos frigidus]
MKIAMKAVTVLKRSDFKVSLMSQERKRRKAVAQYSAKKKCCRQEGLPLILLFG